ncbi:hypothetical protein [Infirmifilum sp.]|uniref:hypothetical protein n=1 Tax=Infirmifilum sp. TaxID=2856575 RepID=UPI003D1004B4
MIAKTNRRKMITYVLLGLMLAVFASGAIVFWNITAWKILGSTPPVKKLAGTDLGNPSYGVKKASVYYRVEDGYNVTYVEVIVPRCHWTTFNPVLILSSTNTVPAILKAVSISGPYLSQLSTDISIAGVLQVRVTSGSISQSSGPPVSLPSSAGLRVLIGSGAPLGVEVARLETWLLYNYSNARVSQKIVWIFKTPSSPPRVVIFYDGFESGTLTGWQYTDYAYAEQKIKNVKVTERCWFDDVYPVPQTITDTTRPVAGSWLAWIGFRDQVTCEPSEARDDYLQIAVNVPSSIDGVEVRFVNVTFWWRFLTWDSANYDYINLVLSKGATTYYFKQQYNPNPGGKYGPFKDTGWQRNSTIFSGLAGSTATLKFLLHTYSDQYYRSWLYVDEVYFIAVFDCIPAYVDPILYSTQQSRVQQVQSTQKASVEGIGATPLISGR